jgi:hypothetical protein
MYFIICTESGAYETWSEGITKFLHRGCKMKKLKMAVGKQIASPAAKAENPVRANPIATLTMRVQKPLLQV